MQPFTIAVPDEVIDDLHRRLDHARWPDQAPGEPWSFGIPVAEVQAAVDHWRHHYDWRAREAAMNRWPQFLTEAEGEQVHFLHVRSRHDDATPLLLTHGWPGSFVEFLDVIEPLTDPEAHGGTAADAFHVVVPSMPGYGFSGPTRTTGFDSRRVADALADVMAQLGYDRFVAQGGDWGAVVTRWLGRDHADRLIGLHVNMMFAFPASDDPDAMDGVTEADLARFAAAGERHRRRNGLHGDPEHPPADPGLRPHRLTRRARRLDPREVPRLERPRRGQHGRDVRDGPVARQPHGLLGHQHRRFRGPPLRRVGPGGDVAHRSGRWPGGGAQRAHRVPPRAAPDARGPGRRRPTTSSTGASRIAAGTSPRSSGPRASSTRCGRSVGSYGRAEPTPSCRRSEPSTISSRGVVLPLGSSPHPGTASRPTSTTWAVQRPRPDGAS